MDQLKFTLVSFGQFENDFLGKLIENLNKEFDCRIKIVEGQLDLSDFYDFERQQYNADKLLKEVDDIYASKHTKTIGLFNVDIYIPIFTYIFGQAILNGRSGIASIYRLSNKLYGIEPNTKLQMERFSKEITHELGHTLGLFHCHIPDCVMRSVTYVEDIDQKSAGFCAKCSKELDARF